MSYVHSDETSPLNRHTLAGKQQERANRHAAEEARVAILSAGACAIIAQRPARTVTNEDGRPNPEVGLSVSAGLLAYPAIADSLTAPRHLRVKFDCKNPFCTSRLSAGGCATFRRRGGSAIK